MFKMGSLQYSSDLSGRETLLRALLAFSKEDFSVRLPAHLDCIDAEVALAFNAAAETNERFLEQSRQLAERMVQVERESQKVKRIKTELAGKTAQKVRGTRDKREFLASILHEQRALMNVMLTLAKRLADNDDHNLSSKQIDHAQTLYSAGTHVLSLIDDISDLGCMDSGAAMSTIGPERLSDLCNDFLRSFRQMARDKGLTFEVDLAPGLPAEIHTDGKRLRQVLRNLLSNAFKFTQQGKVTLHIAPAAGEWSKTPAQAGKNDQWVEFAITDTGIGIPASKLKILAQAFNPLPETQACVLDGIGLGLTISRELTGMLNGQIRVLSAEGTGSRFSLYLPLVREVVATPNGASRLSAKLPSATGTRAKAKPPKAGHDKESRQMLLFGPQPYLGPKSRRSDGGMVLIVESDAQVAALMLEVVQKNGYQGEVAADLGKLWGLVRDIEPDAILLGMNLSDSDGWTVFDLLKRDPETRQLPVSMIYMNGDIHKCLQISALDGGGVIDSRSPSEVLVGLRTMAGRAIGNLLVVDAVESCRADAGAAWRLDGMEVTVLGAGAHVVDTLQRGNFDGMVVGGALLDMTTIDLMKKLMAMEMPTDLPVAMLILDEEPDRKSTAFAILKRGNELDKALEETTLFLHRAVGNHSAPRNEIPSSRRRAVSGLADKKVLIVDDDIRNIYAMTGALEQQGMIVLHAENGAEGLEALRGNPDTAAVLMDTTMASLDAYDMIGVIRGAEAFRSLPIIAVATEAVHGNREQCIEAGASDTIDKPVNIEQLLSLLRAWLFEAR